jgi:C4-dicarboxylate transporter DctM subunit
MAALAIGALVYRRLGWRDIWESAVDSTRTSAMLFFILFGAAIFGHALTKLRIPAQMVELIVAHEVSASGLLLGLMALIFVLGTFLETISIILITTPVALPALTALNVDPVWYGVLLTINLELALITPPVGMNLFTIKAIARAPIGEVIRGAAPFVVLLIIALLIVLVFPEIALWLPRTMR